MGFLRRIELEQPETHVTMDDQTSAVFKEHEDSASLALKLKKAKSLLRKLNSKPRPSSLLSGEARIGKVGVEYSQYPQAFNESPVKALVEDYINLVEPKPTATDQIDDHFRRKEHDEMTLELKIR